jgi:hypothetical protein
VGMRKKKGMRGYLWLWTSDIATGQKTTAYLPSPPSPSPFSLSLSHSPTLRNSLSLYLPLLYVSNIHTQPLCNSLFLSLSISRCVTHISTTTLDTQKHLHLALLVFFHTSHHYHQEFFNSLF